MEDAQEMIENNEILKKYFEYPIEELTLMRMYINLNLITLERNKENLAKIRTIKTCFNQSYNFLDYILSYRYKVDSSAVSVIDTFDKFVDFKVCEYCKSNSCIKKSLAILLDEVDKYNNNHINKLTYLNIIDSLLNRKVPQFTSVPEKNFFKKVDLIDLMYVQLILESDLIEINKYDDKSREIEFSYLDLTNKENNEYYINNLLEFYKNKKNEKKIVLNIDNENDIFNDIFNEKEKFNRIYKISAYYKYLIEYKKIDIIKKLRELLAPDSLEQGISVRAHYFMNKYFQKVEDLPYSKKTKEKIYNILNYILNYRYKTGIPHIPINILIYSNDREGVEKISEIIGEAMWFFGYLSKDMRYYEEYINNIILDKFKVQKLFYDKDGNRKNGILLLHNFENLLYTDFMQKNLILNILTDEMQENNSKVCTIIYGERANLKQLIGNQYKLSQMLINFELEIDNLDVKEIYELLIEKLKKNMNVSGEIKEKIYNYIKATYRQSDIRNLEYVNKIYNLIILNMNNTFSLTKKQDLKLKDIPEAYNTRDLPTIMKDINNLVGLKEIKEQINDLIYLLKFNKKVNLDIKNFNLHMVFSGNPGTGKTTVGRLITDIFYNLGYINQNKLTEVTAKDLIAEYVGQTAGKTFNVVKAALGGVLFIDEAYMMTMGNEEGAQYGYEAIATLLTLMEDYKDKLIVIFAGYKEEMEHFQEANPGLVSRIGYNINFPDYTLDELTQIYLNLLEKNKLKITDEALEKLKKIIKESSLFKEFGNARYINTVFQKVLIEHSKNIECENKKKNLLLITENDINYEKLIAENKKKKIGF